MKQFGIILLIIVLSVGAFLGIQNWGVVQASSKYENQINVLQSQNEGLKEKNEILTEQNNGLNNAYTELYNDYNSLVNSCAQVQHQYTAYTFTSNASSEFLRAGESTKEFLLCSYKAHIDEFNISLNQLLVEDYYSFIYEHTEFVDSKISYMYATPKVINPDTEITTTFNLVLLDKNNEVIDINTLTEDCYSFISYNFSPEIYTDEELINLFGTIETCYGRICKSITLEIQLDYEVQV